MNPKTHNSMKRLISCMAGVALFIPASPAQEKPAETPESSKILIVYYSKTGNTRKVADLIQSATGGKTFEIVPVNAYPEDYHATTEQAKKEINEGFKPELKNNLQNVNAYDVVFVGSPCWWGTMAPPVATFLSSHNFEGKTIIPFMTHGGSGLGRYVEEVKKLVPKADVVNAKAFQGSRVDGAKDEVKAWVDGMKITR